MSASLAEVESRSRRWEMEAKEGMEKVARVEVERDAARHEASMAAWMPMQQGASGRRWSPS